MLIFIVVSLEIAIYVQGNFFLPSGNFVLVVHVLDRYEVSRLHTAPFSPV